MSNERGIALDNIDEALKIRGAQEIVYVDSLNISGRAFYPVNLQMWDAMLKYYTEEQLSQFGIIKTDYLEVV